MQCMLLTPNNTLLMGGHQNVFTEYDLQAQQEIKQVKYLDIQAIFTYLNSML